MQAADTPLDLDDRWALGHISPAWPGNGAERTEFRTYSGGGGRAGVRAQGVGTGWDHLAYLTHTVGLWMNSSSSSSSTGLFCEQKAPLRLQVTKKNETC